MRTRILAALAVASLLGGASTALAAPSGSYERNNQVTCDTHPRSPTGADVVQRNGGAVVRGNTGTTYVGTRGLEACGDNGGSWRGRVIVTTDEGGYVAYDGATWGADPAAEDNGCVRVKASTVPLTQSSNGDAEQGC